MESIVSSGRVLAGFAVRERMRGRERWWENESQRKGGRSRLSADVRDGT